MNLRDFNKNSWVMISIILFISSLAVGLYLYLKERLNYWKYRGLPYIATDVYTSLKIHFYNPVALFDHYARIYEELSEHEYGGSFLGFRPQFVVREPELIKHILIKDFNQFRDRGSVNYDQYDPITHHIFSVPGDIWRGLSVLNWHNYLNILLNLHT